MTQSTVTFEFKDLPFRLFAYEKEMNRFTAGVETEVFYELGEKLETEWRRATRDRDLLFYVHIQPGRIEEIACLMNNLYGAKLVDNQIKKCGKMKKKLRWVAWFETPVCFNTKKEMLSYCKGKIVMMSKITN